MVSLARSIDERQIIVPLNLNSGVSDNSIKVTNFEGTPSSDIIAVCLGLLKTLEESLRIEFLTTNMNCICTMLYDLFARISALKIIIDSVISLRSLCNTVIQLGK
jgi:hypothetical protein